MPTKPAKKNPAPADESKTIQVQVRMPKALFDELNRYVSGLNEKRSYPKLTRTDVILGALDWVIRTNAKWESR